MVELGYFRLNHDEFDRNREINGLGKGLKNQVSEWLGFDVEFCMIC